MSDTFIVFYAASPAMINLLWAMNFRFARMDSIIACALRVTTEVFSPKQSTMNNPFEEIFKRLENIEKMISPVGSSSSEEPDSRQSVLVKISVASRITGYSVNYLYHLASSGAIPYVKRGRSLRFDVNELQQWMQQQYIPASNKLSDERKKE